MSPEPPDLHDGPGEVLASTGGHVDLDRILGRIPIVLVFLEPPGDEASREALEGMGAHLVDFGRERVQLLAVAKRTQADVEQLEVGIEGNVRILADPAGALADRYGRKPVIVPATLLTAASMVAFCVAPDYPWFVVACVVWGVATAVTGAAPAAYAADCAPPGMNAAAMSSYRMLSDAGYVIGPIGLGLLADLQGSQVTLIVSAVMLFAVGVAFARCAPESYRAGKG